MWTKARVGAERLLEIRQEGDHVVPGRRLDLVDPLADTAALAP